MLSVQCIVAPFVGAWIEIYKSYGIPPSHRVAPFVGAWIEMHHSDSRLQRRQVAPFVGAWIEIKRIGEPFEAIVSLRSSERGLK